MGTEISVQDNFLGTEYFQHLKNEIHVHQSTYTKKIFNKFYMDKAHLLSNRWLYDH